MKKITSQIFYLLLILCCVNITAHAATIELGIDRLFTEPYLSMIKNKRIGVLANAASVNAQGINTIDLLAKRADIKLVALFGAEHGIAVNYDTHFKDSHDSSWQLPVYSLYGKNQQPTENALKSLDILIIDIQDVGLRFYTYSATMAKIMNVANKMKKQVIILDRPNPLNWEVVEGPQLDKDYTQKYLTTYLELPMRHGLTMGEMALFYKEFAKLSQIDLVVVPMVGWQREQYYPETGLKWLAPSPALPTFEQTFLYGVFGPLESLNLSVGRSQNHTTSFKRFGAPWITTKQAQRIVATLNKQQLPGLTFNLISWTPDRREYSGKKCHGFSVNVTDYNKVDAFQSLLTVLQVMNDVLDSKQLKLNSVDAMLGDSIIREHLENDKPVPEIVGVAQQTTQQYKQDRKDFLLY